MTDEDQDRILYALGHDLRRECFYRLYDGASSPSRLSETLKEKLGKVCYHIKVLRDNGLIALVRTRQVRGATEHIYRSMHPSLAIEPLYKEATKYREVTKLVTSLEGKG